MAKACQRDTSKYEIRAIFAQFRVMFVNESAHERVPDYINDSHDQKHHRCHSRIEAIDIGVEKQ